MNESTAPASHLVEISRGAKRLPQEPDEVEMRAWLGDVLGRLGSSASSVSVRVVGAEEMRALNARYRGNPQATNVLAFPDNVRDEAEHRLLGDIAVCNQVVLEESRRYLMPFRNRYAQMLVHGLLHLLGHDHVGDEERAEMEHLERDLLARLGMSEH